MNAVVIEHVPVSELPALWRAKLFEAAFAPISQVTVRLEQESVSPQEHEMPLAVTENPLFGLWRDRQDMTAMAANRMRQFVLDAPKMGAVNIRAMLDEGRD